MSIELENSFEVPVPPEQAWDVLLDVRRVAPCMPGASVDEVTGDEVTGRIKVKLGPITLTYTGRAKFTHRDDASHEVSIEASGKETRGAGTASATVHARLEPQDGRTRVTMRTSLNVTGRPAQFGRGVMSDVAGRLVERFSANLAEQLATADGPAQETRETAAPDDAGPGSRRALPIEELNLSARSASCLRSEGIRTVGDLTARSGSDLLAIRGLGEKSVGEIEGRLGELGLRLKDTGAEPVPAAPAAASTATAATSGTTAAAGREEPEKEHVLNLFDVAAGPVLKRVLPAAATLALLIVLASRVRRLGRRH